MRLYHLLSLVFLVVGTLFTILALSAQHRGWFERTDSFLGIWQFGLKGYCIRPLEDGTENLRGCHWYETEPSYAPVMAKKARKFTDAGNASMGFAITSLILVAIAFVLALVRILGHLSFHGKKVDLLTMFFLGIAVLFTILAWAIMIGVHTRQSIRKDSDWGPPTIRWAWILMFLVPFLHLAALLSVFAGLRSEHSSMDWGSVPYDLTS